MRYLTSSRFYLVLLSLVASFFMFYRLGQVPPLYPWADEASAGQDALATLNGAFRWHYPDQGGGGNLWVYLAALAFGLVEPNLLTLRWLAGLMGTVAVLWSYGAATELLRTFMPVRRARLYSLLAALWMAISTWYMIMNRVAWPPVLGPIAISAATFFLWRGFRTKQASNFVGLGLALGLSLYLYVPSRMIGIVPVAFLGLETGLSLACRRTPAWWSLRRQLLLAAGVMLLSAAPMLILYLTRPETFTSRIEEVNIQAGSSYEEAFIESLQFHADTFGLTLNWQRTPFEGLILGSLTTLFFWMGMSVVFWRISFPASRYLLLWWFLLMIPGLAAPALVHDLTMLRRVIGALPVTFIFPALALEFIASRGLPQVIPVSVSKKVIPVTVTIVASGTLILTAWQTHQGFFVQWPKSESMEELFNPEMVGLVDWAYGHTTAQNTFIFPIRAIRTPSSYPWIHTMRFLYRGAAAYIPNHEPDVAEALVAAVQDKSEVYLLSENQADPKGQFLYLLNRLGKPAGQEEVFWFKVQRFKLLHQQLDKPVQRLKPGILFGTALRLQGADFGISLQGERRLLWVELDWQTVNSKTDYQVVVKLQDSAGHLIVQQDKLLLNNLYAQPTSAWPTGSVEKDYYLLEVPPVMLPGAYQLSVGVYDPQTLQSLPPKTQRINRTDLTALIGSVNLPPINQTTRVEPGIPISGKLDEGRLLLKGLDGTIPSQLDLGETITLPTLFQIARPSISPPVQLSLGLESPEQSWLLGKPLVFKTPRDWPTMTPFRIYLEGRIPRIVEGGEYNLVLFARTDHLLPERVVLGEVIVTAREHLFELPAKADITRKIASFGNVAELQGYDLDLRPGNLNDQQGSLTLYWEAEEKTDISYKVFVHLLNAKNQIVAQVDQEPQDGRALTTSWLPGEIIIDHLEFPIDERLTQVTAIAIGLYDPATGERLPVRNGASLGEETLVKVLLRG